MSREQYGSTDLMADAQIRQLLNKISNLQFDLAEIRAALTVTDDMGRALIAKHRELWPGAGWPPLDAAKELLAAAISASPAGGRMDE